MKTIENYTMRFAEKTIESAPPMAGEKATPAERKAAVMTVTKSMFFLLVAMFLTLCGVPSRGEEFDPDRIPQSIDQAFKAYDGEEYEKALDEFTKIASFAEQFIEICRDTLDRKAFGELSSEKRGLITRILTALMGSASQDTSVEEETTIPGLTGQRPNAQEQHRVLNLLSDRQTMNSALARALDLYGGAAFEEAIKHLHRLKGTAQLFVGNCHRDLGKSEQAAQMYREIHKAYPDAVWGKKAREHLLERGVQRKR